MAYKKGITAFVPTYNEEKRIGYTLQSLVWCDEVILVDKYSSDKTVDIAKTFSNVKVFLQERTDGFDGAEFLVFMQNCTTEWCMVVTASDIIHPDLALKIRKLIKQENFNYDAIRVPYRPYMLGICEKYSPWYEKYSDRIVKTSNITINQQEVHYAFETNIQTVYPIIVDKKEEAYYHLTHESADSVIERHRRYWIGEATTPEPLSKTLKRVIVWTIKLFFPKRTFFYGKAGIALAFSYLSYYMMSYVYKWDHNYSKANETYSELRSMIMTKWENYNKEEGQA